MMNRHGDDGGDDDDDDDDDDGDNEGDDDYNAVPSNGYIMLDTLTFSQTIYIYYIHMPYEHSC